MREKNVVALKHGLNMNAIFLALLAIVGTIYGLIQLSKQDYQSENLPRSTIASFYIIPTLLVTLIAASATMVYTARKMWALFNASRRLSSDDYELIAAPNSSTSGPSVID